MAFPDSYPELRTAATRSPGGASFWVLPGLRQAENGAGHDAFWSAPPAAVPYTMQVSDPLLRTFQFGHSAASRAVRNARDAAEWPKTEKAGTATRDR